jgi:hypothetical protein
MKMFKSVFIGACLAAIAQTTCFAQNFHQQFERSETSAGVFFRYSPSGTQNPNGNATFGFGVYQSRPMNFDSGAQSSSPSPARIGVEYRLDSGQQGLWLRGNSLNTASEVRLNSRVRENYGIRQSDGGNGGTLLMVAGVVVVVALAAALAKDSSPTLCSGNTVPNPLTGRCEPLVL